MGCSHLCLSLWERPSLLSWLIIMVATLDANMMSLAFHWLLYNRSTRNIGDHWSRKCRAVYSTVRAFRNIRVIALTAISRRIPLLRGLALAEPLFITRRTASLPSWFGWSISRDSPLYMESQYNTPVRHSYRLPLHHSCQLSSEFSHYPTLLLHYVSSKIPCQPSTRNLDNNTFVSSPLWANLFAQKLSFCYSFQLILDMSNITMNSRITKHQ